MKPCIVCGEPSPNTRCEDCRKDVMRERNQAPRRTADSNRWKKLSLKVRKLQPWCSTCGATERLQADHLIPVGERPDLEFAIENLDVKCASHNAAKSNRVTDEERAEVEHRLAERRARLLRRVGG